MKRTLLVAAFVVYLIAVAAVTIVPTDVSRQPSPLADHINLTPVKYSFRCFSLAHRRYPILMPFCLRNTVGNIILFLPLGVLLPMLASRFRSFVTLALTAVCCSVGIEVIQLSLRLIGSVRSVDIDDVLLNTFGACLGYAIYWVGNAVGGER